MSPTKKRKLNGSSDPSQLSAFAARKSFQAQKTKAAISSSSSPSPDVKEASSTSILVSSVKANPPSSAVIYSAVQDSRSALHGEGSGATKTALEDDEDYDNSSFQSRAGSPQIPLGRPPAITLSNFKPSRGNFKELKTGILSLKIAPGERLVVLGQYEITVEKGQITLLGATLQPSKTKYRVCVPSSHSLPVIRCLATDVNEAEIQLHQCESGLENLKSLSPLFDKLWNDGSGPLNDAYQSFSSLKRSSFQILFSSSDGPKKAYLQPILSSPEWNEALSKLSTPSVEKISRIIICGPKSSGKSTFAKLLLNKLLSGAGDISRTESHQSSGVAILDLDPGQPEYSVPGQLSLVHVQVPNFGPPFSHPSPDNKSRIIRAHAIAAITPSMDPSLYMACALDLFAHYHELLSTVPSCPLIINTPGWVLGTGLEILKDLIGKIRPTQVIYMSQDGPLEVVESLRDSAKAIPVITLPSQISEYATKTAAHLRTMQTMSYLHLNSMNKKGLAWNSQPLSSLPPWEIRYSGENSGILGIMCYGEQPPADLLLDSINGSLMGLVVIDDMAAIPGWETREQDVIDEDEKFGNDQPYEVDTDEVDTADVDLHAFDDENPQPQHLAKPLIVRTSKEDLPYFNPGNAISLDPKHSHCIGVTLVRGIDITRRRLQIITPMPSSVIEEINEAGKSIVLISGKFDTPGWAYTEELNLQISLQKEATKQQSHEMEVEDEDEEEESGNYDVQEERALGEGFHDAPWVERQEGSQGRGVAARVWRVRRDLGKSGD